MTRLIDADAIKFSRVRIVHDDGTIGGYNAVVMSSEIKHAPTVDAVPVIRCKDCRWGRKVCGNIECCCDMNVPPEYHGYDWFCPNGEREKKNETQ